MIEKLRNSLRQLRWKLTLSYTAVSVGTMLIVLFMLALLVFPTVLIPGNALTPELLITTTNEQVVPIFRGLLAASPLDLVQIDAILKGVDQVGTIITNREFIQIGQIQVNLRTTAEVDYFVFDPDGSLLGTTNRTLVPLVAAGKPFNPDQVPGLAGPLQAALAGEADPEHLFSTIQPDEEFVWAVPVLDAGRTEGDVLGALVVKLRSVPTRRDLTSHALILAARSLLVIVLGAGAVGGVFGSLTAEAMVSRFTRLWSATEAWSRGDFSRYVHDRSGDEIGQLASRLNAMAAQLKNLLQERQQMAVSEERNRLARDLHDSAKQQALAASFQLGTAVTLLDSDPPTARKHLLEADKLVDSVRVELTDLIHELRPPTERGDLKEIINSLAVEWAHQNDIRTDVTVQVAVVLPLEMEQTLCRILQEALANIARHSEATLATIALNHDDSVLSLKVSDNGVGFDTGARYSGMGLRSMRERAKLFSGNLTIQSEPGQGTTISATFLID
jgi:NarL family two-component system sensor histidine kinase LiaS